MSIASELFANWIDEIKRRFPDDANGVGRSSNFFVDGREAHYSNGLLVLDYRDDFQLPLPPTNEHVVEGIRSMRQSLQEIAQQSHVTLITAKQLKTINTPPTRGKQ